MKRTSRSRSLTRSLMALFGTKKGVNAHERYPDEYYRNIYFDKRLFDRIELVARIERVSEKKAARQLIERGFSVYMGEKVKEAIQMSIKESKAAVRRYYELFNQKQIDACNQLIAPRFVSHRTTGDVSREDVVNGPAMLFAAFPDLKITIEHVVAEGDMVAYREIGIGTHKGDFMGIAPTGNKIEMINTCILRIADGKWAEAWPTMDELRLMQQLGVIPKQ